MKLLVFTDSLSLPRNTPEICTFDQTWPQILRENNHEVCSVSIGGATIQELKKQLFYFKSESTYFDAVIIQSGIVDCAPRFVKKWELKVLQNIPFVGSLVLKTLNSTVIRNVRNIAYTSPFDFAKNLNNFAESFTCPVLFLEIVPVHPSYEIKLPGIGNRVNTYNALIQNQKNYISLQKLPVEGIMSDFHHLNAIGHKFIADKIQEKIKECAIEM